MNILITGGAGFIGGHFVRTVLRDSPQAHVTNLDKLTYAGNLDSLRDITDHPRHRFVRGDIADPRVVDPLFREGFDVVINFAAESHVDRSILDASPFVQTNVVGTQVLLDASLRHGVRRYVQVSTDEVYGPAPPGVRFSEAAHLDPTSPYAASKAAADLLCLAYRKTHGLPVVVTRCTNNYGAFQFPEKFIPLTITNAIEGKPVPIYGDGQQERDWLFVEDHCAALLEVVRHENPDTVLNIASGETATNIDVAKMILALVGAPVALLEPVRDRPAHDRRYALDASRITSALDWAPKASLEAGLVRTVEWFRSNRQWWQAVKTGEYLRHYTAWYQGVLKGASPG